MAYARVSEVMPASCEAVVDLVHDYGRRLQWDTLLREAYVEGDGPATSASSAASSRR